MAAEEGAYRPASCLEAAAPRANDVTWPDWPPVLAADA